MILADLLSTNGELRDNERFAMNFQFENDSEPLFDPSEGSLTREEVEWVNHTYGKRKVKNFEIRKHPYCIWIILEALDNR